MSRWIKRIVLGTNLATRRASGHEAIGVVVVCFPLALVSGMLNGFALGSASLLAAAVAVGFSVASMVLPLVPVFDQ